MRTLIERQAEFIANLLDEEEALPQGWTSRHAQGLAIYRNNYRAALTDALLETFQRTARWVGQEAFRQAAAHHLIAHPPTGWTLDDVGSGFDATLAELFTNDPEVSELAWTEWSMHQAFGAQDAEPMTVNDFAAATAKFQEADWSSLCLIFMPRIATRTMQHDIAAIWHALNNDDFGAPEYELAEPLSCHVYREGEQPTFLTAPGYENMALEAMIEGASFGHILDLLSKQLPLESAANEAGAMLGRWLHNGMVLGIR